MSNSWFQFKQFTIQQDKCAMKVSTDACIQAAWTPLMESVNTVLDIGTGTGLLSLMLAQRLPAAHIDALESESQAAEQAAQNSLLSPFNSRIAVHHCDATQWTSDHRYDLIICNPPFFTDSLRGRDHARNQARHSGSLNLQSLLDLLHHHLSPKGYASIMLPPSDHQRFSALAQQGQIFLRKKLEVQDSEKGRITRVIGIYCSEAIEFPGIERLIIKNDDAAYSAEFTALLQPFYLYL